MKLKSLLLLAGLLIAVFAHGQLTGVVTYDFTDGSIIAAGQSADGNLTLSGNYSHHGAQYGLNMKVDGEINITVTGSSTIRFLGSQYSSLNMVGTAVDEGDLGTHPTQVANDLSDTYDFVYSGPGTTLNFLLTEGTGNDLYLPSIEVIPAQSGADATMVSDNIINYYDFRDGSIVPTNTDGLSDLSLGLIDIIVGPSNAYGYNGTQHGCFFKAGNQVVLQVEGNSYIKVGGSIFSNGTITLSSATGDFDIASQASMTSGNFGNDGSTVDFLYVGGAGEVTLDFTGTNYVPYIETVPVPFDVSLNPYVQKSGTISVNGVDITLTSGATAADDAFISLSEGVVLSANANDGWIALDLGGQDPSSLMPTVSGDIESASITGTTMLVTYADPSADPTTFSIELYDNSFLHGIVTYDFTDGTIIAAGQSPDGTLTLAGNYSHHGDQYGLNMKVDGDINIDVDGSCAVSFLGSQYSSLNMEGTATDQGDLGSQDTQVENDLSDTFEFVYCGPAENLNFKTTPGSGNDLYLPSINVIPSQLGAAYADATKNVPYYFDFRDGSIVPTNTTGQVDFTKGLVEIVTGSSNAYGYNGSQHGCFFKEGNQVILAVKGNSYIKVGGSIFSNGTISVSSATGNFDVDTQPSMTSGNFGNDGSTVDFLYVGDEGFVTLDFTGTNYVPHIELCPVPYDVSLTPWVQKAGTITINDVEISLQSGEDASSDPSVTLSEGTVVSATIESASILIDLGGEDLSFYTPEFTGQIDTVIISNDSLLVTYADETSDPASYVIKVADNSVVVEAEPGVTYTYNFYDGSELPQISYQSLRYTTYVSHDGILTINSNTDEEARQFGYHDSQHGGVFFPGNSFDMIVAGNAIITFIVDTYGVAEDAVFEMTNESGTVLGTIAAQNLGGVDGFPVSFPYNGPAGVVTATLLSQEFPTAEIYLHGLSIQNEAIITSNGKTDVWDFSATVLDTALYNNQLTVDIINAWYDPGIEVGSIGNVLPSSWSEEGLAWVGGGNDRLRSTNTELTRYDNNISNALGYLGRIYVNSAANPGRYLSFTLNADDEVTIVTKTDSGGELNFEYVPDPEYQTDIEELGTDVVEVTFVAKNAGTYHVYDTEGKPSYYRIFRKPAVYSMVSGAVDTTGAGDIPADFGIVFTNESGKMFFANTTGEAFDVELPVDHTYEVSLSNANGYIISSANTLEVTEMATDFDIVIEKVELYTVSGSITGLGVLIADLSLYYTPDPGAGVIYEPEPIIDEGASTYTVQLQPNVEYTISAEGVNDYFIPSNTITIGAMNTAADVAFSPKPVYTVSITTTGLTPEQIDELSLSFSNLNEPGYDYSFTDLAAISLRDGVYSITADGVDAYPLELGPTSNLTVDGADTEKTLGFRPVSYWPFDDREISIGDPTYKGLLFTGEVANEANKSHLYANPGATIQVPVQPGQRVLIDYYYTADFSIEGEAPITTNTQSTSILEHAQYDYPGAVAAYVTLTIGNSVSTTYITDIRVYTPVAYTANITVGEDKDYPTINEALDAVRRMDRPEDERVTICIDPGDYEEMLVIDMNNVTLKNCSANPEIDLQNEGVGIGPEAVRITSYYGHGYNYYSMGNDQKWNADVLQVNTENGYFSYENRGAGTTNGSYWNTTVAVYADGFEAEHIIFENSFNQYISQKEANDIVEEWGAGSPGVRPTDYGNTAVQDRSFRERAAAIAFIGGADKGILYKCRVIGRQDSFFGDHGCRVVMYKGSAMGGVDYIFGGMTAVFYQTELTMNTADNSVDRTYITAAQQSSGRGYLMNNCTVNSTVAGTETASQYGSKPGYFGRPWAATTSEVVFYNTVVETSEFPGEEGTSLIEPIGWENTLGGESIMMYEYGTNELSGEDNIPFRAGWSTVLTDPVLNDGTDITNFNFTKGNDGWDPLPDLIASDPVGIHEKVPVTAVAVHSYGNTVYISNVKSDTQIRIFDTNGVLFKTLKTNTDGNFDFADGFWIIEVQAADGMKAVKVFLQ